LSASWFLADAVSLQQIFGALVPSKAANLENSPNAGAKLLVPELKLAAILKLGVDPDPSQVSPS